MNKAVMLITLTNTGKRFNREWIFRGVNLQFNFPGRYAITGPNGSGKSTLLQVIAGAISHSGGEVRYELNGQLISAEQHFREIAIAAPYLELVEELTAAEMMRFHAGFKPLTTSPNSVLEKVSLKAAAHRQIRYFSSGMKQRLKLGLAFFSNTPVLLLDEPTTNLDAEGVSLYQSLVRELTDGRLIIISSNVPEEYACCEIVICMENYK